jgi:hypothetical protein
MSSIVLIHTHVLTKNCSALVFINLTFDIDSLNLVLIAFKFLSPNNSCQSLEQSSSLVKR